MSSVFNSVTMELLVAGKTVRFRATGDSMQPAIRDGEMVTVIPVAEKELTPGKIVLFGDEQQLRAHRIRAIRRDATGVSGIVTRGDASHEDDELIPLRSVIGVVTELERAGEKLVLNDFGARVKFNLRSRMLRAEKIRTLRLRLREWRRGSGAIRGAQP